MIIFSKIYDKLFNPLFGYVVILIGYMISTSFNPKDSLVYYLDNERYYDAIECYELMPTNSVEDENRIELGILKCRFELKQYEHFEQDIKALIYKISKQDDTINQESKLLYAKYLIEQHDLENAKAILSSTNTTDIYLMAEKENCYGNIYNKKNKFKDAIASYNKSIRLYQKHKTKLATIKVGQVYNNLGTIYYFLSDYNKALHFYIKALETYQKYKKSCLTRMAQTYYNIALIHIEHTHYTKAIASLENAIAINQTYFGTQHTRLAECYGLLGSVYLYINQIDKALDYFHKDRAIIEKTLAKNHIDVAYSYFDCGMAYNKIGDFDNAIFYLKKCLAIRNLHLSDYTEDISETYSELANAFITKEEYDSAANYLNILLANEYRNEQQNILVARANYQKGIISFQRKEHQQAKKYFLFADSLYRKLVGNSYLDKNRLYLYLSEIAQQQNEHATAKSYIKESLPDSPHAINELFYSYLHLIQLLFSEDKQKRVFPTEKYANYLQTFKQHIRLLKNYNQHYFGEYSTLYNSSLITAYNHFAIELIYFLYTNTHEPKYINEAFYFMEQNKALVLQKQNSLDNKQKELQASIFELTEQLKLPKYLNNKTKAKQLETRLYQLKSDYEKYTTFRNPKTNNSISKIQCQQRLYNKQLCISYSCTANYIFRITIDKTTSTFELIDSTNKINFAIKTLTEAIQTLRHKKEDAQYLSKSLLHNINLHQYQELIISSDGNLSHLPFDILLNEKKEYLIQSHSICSAFSIGSFFSKQHNSNFSNKTILCFAPSYSNTQYENINNQKEVKNIDQHQKTIIANGNLLDFYKEKSGHYNYLHIAAHTAINSTLSEKSGIVLQPKQHKLLTLTDIQQHPIHAKLVCLSACQGLYGKAYKGEGILNFAWSFFYAGANNILTTYWNASDQAAQKITSAFYAHLVNTNNLPKALQQAKKEYISKTDAIGIQPLFWSNWVIYGTQYNQQNFCYIWITIIILALIVVVVWHGSKKYI